MRALRVSVSAVICWVSISIAAPTPVVAEGGCLNGVREKFRVVSEPMRKVHEAVKGFLNRKGRAQAKEVERILAEKMEQAKREATDPADPVKAWEEFLKQWEDEVTGRMTDKKSRTYPKIEELLALMAAKSPTFKGGLIEFLTNKGTMRFKVMSHFMESIRSDGPGSVGGRVTHGKRFWNLWQSRIKLPARRTWTMDDFALFMTEVSNAMFRSIHPEPGFAMTWIRAFGQIRMSPASWKLWEAFANKFLLDYRARYRSFMEGVTLEAYGKPRPEVIADFYKWGPWDTIMRRLAAFKVITSKQGARIVENSGLSAAELDAVHGGMLYNMLPRRLKKARILAKDPELYRNALFAAEVEKLSLELMYFMRPVVSGLFLYYTMIEPAYAAHQQNERRKSFEDDVRTHPERYVPQTPHADDDRTSSFREQIDQLTIEKRALERELEEGNLTDEEKARHRRAIAAKDRRITHLNEMLTEHQRSQTRLNPH